jgi:hypothetical protein
MLEFGATEAIVACCIHPGIFSNRVLIWVIIASFDFGYSQPSSCSTVYKLCRSENVATYTKKPNHTCTSQAALCQLLRQKPVHCLWWTVEKGLVVSWWRWGPCCWACSTDQSVGEVNIVEYPYIWVAGRWDVTRAMGILLQLRHKNCCCLSRWDKREGCRSVWHRSVSSCSTN